MLNEPIFIVGLGQTIKHWDGKGFSIGVNDVSRYRETSALVVVNNFGYDPDRNKYVINAKPKHGLYTNVKQYFDHPCFTPLPLINKFNHRKPNFQPDQIYYDNTSTFIAASLAFYSGFRNIVLVGVDFVGHRNIKKNSLTSTVETYLKMNECFKRYGGEMFLLVNEGAFKDKMSIWRGSR